MYYKIFDHLVQNISKPEMVHPIPKKGNFEIAANWRPVTLLFSAGKILDTIINHPQTQRRINSTKQENSNLHPGIGEGRVLGPLMFILTIICTAAV